MDSLGKMKAENFHLTLTLAEIDVLVKAAHDVADGALSWGERQDLEDALRKLDEAVNL